MSRFYNKLNEKVNKAEIEEALKSTDIKVGAEFEFNVDGSYFQDVEDDFQNRYIESREYDEADENYQSDMAQWERDYREYKEMIADEFIEDENTIPKKLHQWEIDNPEPQEPSGPSDYIQRYESFVVDFDLIRNAVDLSMNNIINSDGWDITEDSSLDENGVELVSPPLEVSEFMDVCPKIFDMIDNIGNTNNACGLHIGVSLKQGMDEVDPMKLILFTDEEYIYKKFDGRKFNSYVKNMGDMIRKELYGVKNYRIAALNTLKTMVRDVDFDVDMTGEHYHGVNTSHLDSHNPYIEFRYMGGEGYHTKWKDVKVIIAQYIYNLKLSRDPNFKKKEYIQKCNRIVLKLERYCVDIEIGKLKTQVDRYKQLGWDSDADAELEKIKIKLRNLERNLNFLPKLTEDERDRFNKIYR